jgi:predicted DNA-binding protein
MATSTITIRLDKRIKDVVMELAKEDERSMSSYVRYVLMKHLHENNDL